MENFKDNNQSLLIERGGLCFALPLSIVTKVISAQEITPVSGENMHLSGVINYKGEIIPVLTLDLKFGLTPKELTVNNKIIITRYNNNNFALIADSADRIITINIDSVTNMEEQYPGLTRLSISGDDSSIIVIYNPEAIFSVSEITEFVKHGS